jgi:hypothetical protein
MLVKELLDRGRYLAEDGSGVGQGRARQDHTVVGVGHFQHVRSERAS